MSVHEAQFTVVSWNCRRATAGSLLWDHLLELDPTVALLQEVGELPPRITDRFAFDLRPAVGRTGAPQKFNTALLVRGQLGDRVALTGLSGWLDEELERFAGNLVTRELLPLKGPALKAVSVYSPAWPIDSARLTGVDTSAVRLTTNPALWLTDVLCASLKHHCPQPTDHWIVAGDFNLSETFDQTSWSAGGNREYLDRMASRLVSCDTGSQERVFGSGLSDHLPLVAHFRV